MALGEVKIRQVHVQLMLLADLVPRGYFWNSAMAVEFSKPTIDSSTLAYLRESLASGAFGGDGPFTRRCHEWLRSKLGAAALLTHSGTAALEMAALLAGIEAGDEVILPSYTFPSTANAVVLRGATPVFVDIREDTLNLDEALLSRALSPRTKAVIVVHYGGIACEMDTILSFAKQHGLIVIEDAAQGYLASYRARPLGTLGAFGCLSFHVSKNVVAGEGGALILNDPRDLERAEIIREKGTNRTRFLRREVDKYEWVEVGSSYLPSDLCAALLLSQLEHATDITARRVELWHRYHASLEAAERENRLRRPGLPPEAQPNGHIYYVLLPTPVAAAKFRDDMSAAGVPCLSHYVPLHSAPAGLRFGRCGTSMRVTEDIAQRLLRLPLHAELTEHDQDHILQSIERTLRSATV